MNEFLNVATNLEIKEISKDVGFNEEVVTDEEPSMLDTDDAVAEANSSSIVNAQSNDENSHFRNSRQLKSKLQLQKNAEGQFSCDQCQSKFTVRSGLWKHIQSKHEGVKHACMHCEYQATQSGSLRTHIQSKHEGVKYACMHCHYQATTTGSLKRHIDSKHM